MSTVPDISQSWYHYAWCRSLKKEQKMKQKKSLAWKERQGLQRKEQATKQKKCVG